MATPLVQFSGQGHNFLSARFQIRVSQQGDRSDDERLETWLGLELKD